LEMAETGVLAGFDPGSGGQAGGMDA
jgi:hypothetical protein